MKPPNEDVNPMGLLQRALKIANWRENRAHQVFLTAPLPYEPTEVHGSQRVWFTNALMALTREELLTLYDHTVMRARECVKDGGDFTPPDVRAHYPVIYGDPPAQRR
ncbi:hypothetical protein D869_gp283 [Caulobacter phage CcrRogue]|uniref:Uncharacterized protein n=1 Tax=Caulobacter phage CcrRogue TaxID=2927986 RepID=K4JNQ2_9CAUD|nr:hypothetical protein D869_gp283 [Caulobacter phage CcrRogue]AFU86631.1 hypothetical protein CcrRogue_gp149 [Caulobacter phage CcrRogue]